MTEIFDINFVLTKQKSDLSSAKAQLNKDKDQLIVGKDQQTMLP